MTSSSIKTQKTARVAIHGQANANFIWWVFHGYGQLVPYFIKNFEGLDPTENQIFAPEGLNRFYLKGTSGRVGASWMTKEEREIDIEDYIYYLNQCYKEYSGDKTNVKHIVLGFSQGVATAARWMVLGDIQPDAFINWAGVFPPDLPDDDIERFKYIPHTLVLGNEDPYWSQDALQQYQNKMKTTFNNFEYFSFEGQHQIHAHTLLQIEQWARNLLMN